MNYQVLKGMSLKLREDSLLYSPKIIVTSGVDMFLLGNKYLLLSLLLSMLLN